MKRSNLQSCLVGHAHGHWGNLCCKGGTTNETAHANNATGVPLARASQQMVIHTGCSAVAHCVQAWCLQQKQNEAGICKQDSSSSQNG